MTGRLALVALVVLAFVAGCTETVAGRPGPAPQTPAAARDHLVAAAEDIAAVLNTIDAADAEGSLDRWESVATGDLLTQFQDNRARYVEQIGSSGSTATAEPLAAAAAEFDRENDTARVLVALSVTVTQDGTTSDPRHNRVELELTRADGEWNANAIRLI